MIMLSSNEKESLDRPAWTQNDLHAYRHKHTGRITDTGFGIEYEHKDFFVKNKQ